MIVGCKSFDTFQGLGLGSKKNQDERKGRKKNLL